MYHLLHSLPLLIAVGLWHAEAFTPLHPTTSRRLATRLHYEDDKLVVSKPVETKKTLDEKTLKQLTKTRPYPLFIAEKVAATVQGTVTSLVKSAAHILASSTDDNDDEALLAHAAKVKPRIVVLGVGWGSAAFLADIDTDVNDVTVVSPRNHFVFTPMLSGSAVGTVDARSITQPVREINRKVKYIEAKATNIDPLKRTVSCESIVCEGEDPDEFDLDYDRLVVTVGATTNTFGIPGVYEHCEFIKDVADATKIRKKLVNCFERAKVPGLSDDEKRKRLSFVVIGAGPAGLEFAAELRDFIEQDGPKYYCDLIPYVSIKLVEASNSVLAPFEEPLRKEAAARITRPAKVFCPKTRRKVPVDFTLLELLLESPVTEVGPHTLTLKDGRVLDHSLAIWAGGIKALPLTSDLIQSLGPAQQDLQASTRGRVAVDPWLRAVGGQGRILALGDCAVNPNEPLPPTGQVASQQGEYLAHVLNSKYDLSPNVDNDDDKADILDPPARVPGETTNSLQDAIAALATGHPEYAKPFQYLNLGILAYTGDCTAVGQISTTPRTPNVLASSHFGNFLWRSVYLAKQVSLRNRLLVMNDWLKRVWFGRDISRL